MPKIVFMPGLAADERIFHSIKDTFIESTVLEWIEPNKGELLSEYAQRLKSSLSPEEEYFIIGVSFGGIVALELSKHIVCSGCLLIGSISSPKSISFTKRQVLKLFRMDSKKIVKGARFLQENFSSSNHLRAKNRRFIRNGEFYSWAYGAISKWTAPELTIPLYHIHGTEDDVFPPLRRLL
jgi:pimeloyl-ACP methyl ester carboxylesterase